MATTFTDDRKKWDAQPRVYEIFSVASDRLSGTVIARTSFEAIALYREETEQPNVAVFAERSDEFSIDDLGRIFLVNDDGDHWDGPYDTLEAATAAAAHWARTDAQAAAVNAGDDRTP